MRSKALEVTSFKLLGYTLREFINANKADIDDWLKQQSGFQSRYILETSDGTIMDLVFWETSEQGTEAMRRIMSATSNSKVHSMIDQHSVSWNIYDVGHFIRL